MSATGIRDLPTTDRSGMRSSSTLPGQMPRHLPTRSAPNFSARGGPRGELHLGALEQRRSQKPAPAPGVHVGQAAVRTNNLKPPSPVAGLRQDIAHHQSVQRSFSTTSALVARINAATQSLTAILSITAFLSQLPNEWANWTVRVSVVPDRLKQLVANLENRVFRRLFGGLTAKTLLTRSSGSVCPVRRAG